jgi:hypothetical protein
MCNKTNKIYGNVIVKYELIIDLVKKMGEQGAQDAHS